MYSVCALGIVPILLESFYVKKNNWTRIIASNIQFSEIQFPLGKRIPLGWPAFPVSAKSDETNKARLSFPKIRNNKASCYLRITAAIDIREEIILAVYPAENEIEIGRFDIKFAHPFQTFSIPVKPEFTEIINREGIVLKMIQGESDAWFYGSDKTRKDNTGLQPHILVANVRSNEDSIRQNFLSMNSFSPFGWIGGCVLDALWEMNLRGDSEASEILRLQLSNLLDKDKGVIFENPRTEPRDGTFNSIEDFLPFAAIVGMYPEHPSVQMAVNYLTERKNHAGLIISGTEISTEGCYTVAYPLSSIAIHRKDSDLARIALDQLYWRKKYLTDENGIYQKAFLEGNKMFKNWGRGIAWYLLGIIKTLNNLEEFDCSNFNHYDEMKQEFTRACKIVASWQSKNGLFTSFPDRPGMYPDTSATAGIGLAFAWGVKTGLLDQEYLQKAKNANESLQPFYTPDGFLSGVAQINRGGETLQAGNYRVISQFGLGLAMQLKTILKELI
jgi:unsaturated rhamnogalacturonyl hydrolase